MADKDKKDKVEIHPSCPKFSSGPIRRMVAKMPFFVTDEKGHTEQMEAVCIHSDGVTAITEETSGKTVGVIAMRKDHMGLFVEYDADRLREFGTQCLNMADYIERESNG